ncbi:hypothetical protein [Weissella confusa]|uniref:hypothetical protein n=1 Tax=Weissella confusa TaxID=1583 RepID=UPI001436C790|nr:hypothetical protein [Weissella confusa]
MTNLLMGIGLVLSWIAIAGVALYFVSKLGAHAPVKPRCKKRIEAYTNAQAKNKYMED